MSNSDKDNHQKGASTGCEIPTLEQQFQAKEILEINQLLAKTSLKKDINTNDIAREFFNVANELLEKGLYDEILNRALMNLYNSDENNNSEDSNFPTY